MEFKNIKTYISLFIFLFINFAFSVKYLSRVTPYYLFLSLFIVSIYLFFWKNRFRFRTLFERFNYLNVVIIILFTIVATFIFTKIPSETLNVDRWSVISEFWNNYFNDQYVYFAKSNDGNYPGPMPFYFILALPFYLLGEFGYFSIAGIAVLFLLLKFNNKSKTIQSIYILLTITSMFYIWEVICRSNIFLNSCLILFSILYLFKSIENKNSNSILWNGLIIGLLLSTRNIFVIPYIIAFIYCLKYQYLSIKKTFLIALICIFTFSLTFVPFIYNHINDFKIMNPFIIQSSFLMPLSYSLFCIFLSFGTYFIVKKKNEVYFYSGLILFLTIVLHYIYHIKAHNFEDAFFNSKADISYFILCVPFILFYLSENEESDNTVN